MRTKICIVLLIFIVNYHKPLQKKLIVDNYIASAEWNDGIGKSSGRNDSAFFSQFFLNFADHTVNTGSSAVDYTAFHAVYRV